jgi:hypothetical protein
VSTVVKDWCTELSVRMQLVIQLVHTAGPTKQSHLQHNKHICKSIVWWLRFVHTNEVCLYVNGDTLIRGRHEVSSCQPEAVLG